MALGMLASDGIHISQRAKRAFDQEPAGLTDTALNKREWDKSGLPTTNCGVTHQG